MRDVKRFLSVMAIAAVAAVAASCETKEAESTTYFQRTISPILSLRSAMSWHWQSGS